MPLGVGQEWLTRWSEPSNIQATLVELWLILVLSQTEPLLKTIFHVCAQVPTQPVLAVSTNPTSLDLTWTSQPHLASDVYLARPGEAMPTPIQRLQPDPDITDARQFTILDLLPVTQYRIRVTNTAGSGQLAVTSEPAEQNATTGVYLFFEHSHVFIAAYHRP